MRTHIAPHDEFDPWGIELALGSWAYELDDHGVIYGPGWYPFHCAAAPLPRRPGEPAHGRASTPARIARALVTIAPNVEYRSWRNEYARLTPLDHRVLAHTRLFVRAQGLGAMVRPVVMEIDLRGRLVSVPDGCPAHLREQAQVKGQRVLDLLLAARRERREGAVRPLDAHRRWQGAR